MKLVELAKAKYEHRLESGSHLSAKHCENSSAIIDIGGPIYAAIIIARRNGDKAIINNGEEATSSS